MRVIAGDFKGRRLQTPPDNSVRPTTDKVKEALFSMIADKIADSRVLDLFSGTGNIGIEALSRGARECVFCDNSRSSISLIKENINHCRINQGARVLPGDFKKSLMTVDGPFDVIFLDPPYEKGFLEDCFRLIDENDLLEEDGLVIAEHRKEEILPEEYYGLKKIKEKRYGIIMLSIYS